MSNIIAGIILFESGGLVGYNTGAVASSLMEANSSSPLNVCCIVVNVRVKTAKQ